MAYVNEEKLRSYMISIPFGEGFRDASQFKPFPKDIINKTNKDQIRYERGRQFAVATNYAIPLKSGKAINIKAFWAFCNLLKSQDII